MQNRNLIIYVCCIIIFLFLRCNTEAKNENLFNEYSSNIIERNVNFFNLNDSILVKKKVFKKFLLKYDSISSEIIGYWGIVNDTVYFINESFMDSCIIKYPILNLKDSIIGKYYIGEAKYNYNKCINTPIFPTTYLVQTQNYKDGIYTISHSVCQGDFPNENSDNDNVLMKISIKYGILDFSYKKTKNGFSLPWLISYKK